MSKKFDVTTITGKYTDASGAEKNRYMTIGAVIETKNGLRLKLEAVPLGWDGWAYLNDPRPRDERGAAPAPRQAAPRQATLPAGEAPADFNDSIPF